MRSIATAVFILIFIGISASLFAQEWTEKMLNPQTNFYEVQESFYRYFDALPEEARRGRGYKQFKRWEEMMEPRVYPSGVRPDGALVWQTLQDIQRQKQSGRISNTLPEWTPVGPTQIPFANGIAQKGGMGRLNFVTFHPTNTNIIFVGTPAGGLWKTTDGGVSWSVLTDMLPVIGCAHLAINPLNPNTMYLATGDRGGTDTYSIGLLRSRDGGATWQTTVGLLTFQVTQSRRIFKVMFHPTDTSRIYVGTSEGLFYSQNAGQTWSLRTTMPTWDFEFAPGNPQIMYAVGTTFSKSVNGGIAWSSPASTPVGWPTSNTVRMEIAVTPADSSMVYILRAATDNGFGELLRSTSFGDTFQIRSAGTPNILGWNPTGTDSGGQGWYDLALAASPTNANLIFTGGVNVWSSSNGGTSWSLRGQWQGNSAPHIHADIHWLQFIPGQGNNLMCANDGGIYRLNDGATSWTDISAGLVITQIYRLSQSQQNPAILLNGTQDNGSNLRDPNGSWKLVVGGDGMDNEIDPTNHSVMFASSQNGNMRRTLDGGLSFTNVKNNGISETGAWVTPYSLSSANTQKIIAGYDNLWLSGNRGDSWTKVTNFSVGTKYSFLEFAPNSASRAVAIRANAVIRYWNIDSALGTVITPISAGPSYTWVAMHPSDTNRMWVTCSGYQNNVKVFATSNAGVTWTNISGNLPNLPVNCITFHDNAVQALYVGTDVGIYYRDNTMNNWILYSNGLPNVIVRELTIQQATQKLRAATYGRGVWEADLYQPGVAGTFTSFVQGTDNDVQVYPNPAGEALFVEVEADLAAQSPVFTLSDAKGRVVFTDRLHDLVNRVDMKLLAEGVYFYSLQSAEGKPTKRGKVVVRH